MKIVGVGEVTEVSCGKKDSIWASTSRTGGITRKEFDEYFSGSEMCCVLKFGKILQLRNPLVPQNVLRGFRVPQSYTYVDASFLEKVYEEGL